MAKGRKRGRERPGEAVSRRPETAALFEQAISAIQQRDFETVERVCRTIVDSDPSDFEAHHLLGLVHIERGRFELAVQSLESSLEGSRKNADVHDHLGLALLEAGDAARAVPSFESALRLRKDHPEARGNLARALASSGQHLEAIAAYDKALLRTPGRADLHCNRGISLEALGRLDSAVEAFRTALDLDSTNGSAAHNLGLALEKQEAERVGRLAEMLDAYTKAAENLPDGERLDLGYLYRRVVPSWHFPMMNDHDRNRAFDAAIRSAVTPDCVVLEIGTGSGLLAMMAARAGAKHVYSCEVVTPIAEVAKQIVRDNGYEDQVTVISKASDEIVIGVDIPQRAHVLITETVDVGLLGEGTLESIGHARRDLLVPGARIVPLRAALYAQLVESSALVGLDKAGDISGFDLSGFNKFSTSPRYLQARVTSYPYRALSAPFEVFQLSFLHDESPSESRQISVTTTPGRADAFVFWFTLHVSDSEVVTNRPSDDASAHWMQAIQLLDEPRCVGTDAITVLATRDTRRVHFRLGS